MIFTILSSKSFFYNIDSLSCVCVCVCIIYIFQNFSYCIQFRWFFLIFSFSVDISHWISPFIFWVWWTSFDHLFELFIRVNTYLKTISLGFVLGFYFALLFGTYSFVSSLCLTFDFYFYELGKISTSPCLSRVSLCGCISCVYCSQLVTLAGWFQLEWVQAWDRPGEVLLLRVHKKCGFWFLAEGMMFHSTVLKSTQNFMCLFRKKMSNITIDYMWISSWVSLRKIRITLRNDC